MSSCCRRSSRLTRQRCRTGFDLTRHKATKGPFSCKPPLSGPQCESSCLLRPYSHPLPRVSATTRLRLVAVKDYFRSHSTSPRNSEKHSYKTRGTTSGQWCTSTRHCDRTHLRAKPTQVERNSLFHRDSVTLTSHGLSVAVRLSDPEGDWRL